MDKVSSVVRMMVLLNLDIAKLSKITDISVLKIKKFLLSENDKLYNTLVDRIENYVIQSLKEFR